MSPLQSDLEQNSSIHSETDVSSITSGEQLGEVEQSSPTTHERSGEEEGWQDDLCHAICVNRWNVAKAILDQNPEARVTAEIDDKGRTALHVAAIFGHVNIVKELLKLLANYPESVRSHDSEKFTALALACRYSGSAQVVKCLVRTNGDLLSIDIKGELPVALAIRLYLLDVGRYLYSVTPLKLLTNRQDHRGSILLHNCFKAQCLDIALDLLEKCEELLFEPIEGKTPIHYIASLNTAILSPSKLVFWKRWIYNCDNYINKLSAIAINHVCLDIQQENRSLEDKAKLTQPGVKQIQELKLQHAQADDLLGLVCKNARKAYRKGVMYDVLQIAAEEGNAKFVIRVSKKIPEIFLSRNFFTFFSEALKKRQAELFNHIYGLRFKRNVLNSISGDEEDTMLHIAAKKASDDILNRIYAPTLQMQKELQWFKEVESLIPPELKGFRNKRRKTGEELFREEHKDLMKEGEKWIKKTATSCSVVGTLIMTIMFAAALSVPGGNDQTLGYPLHIKQPVFKVFVITTTLSLLFSTASVLMFLAILTSKYSEDQFLKSLPGNLIFGLSFLFISIACMIIAFLSTIDLMMKHPHYSWILAIIILASFPIFFFVRSQFPLLLHTCVSTYCNIFDKKVERWP